MFHVPQHLAPAGSLVPTTAAELLRIVVAGDEATRDELSHLAGSFDDLVVLGELEANQQLEHRVRLLTPDVLLYGAPAGVDAAPLTWVARVATPSLVLVSTSAQRAEALAAGARGVMDRASDGRRIHAALRAVGEGLHVRDGAATTPQTNPAENFTARELDVLRLLAAGMTNKEIAASLGITEHTVKFHVNAILGKLGAETRTEAVVQAARRGIVSL